MIPKNIIDDINDLHKLVYAENCDLEQLKHAYEILIKDVIKFYNLPDIDIKFTTIPDNQSLGSYSPYTNDFTINANFLDPSKMPNKHILDYYFAELIHTAFHEARHYLQCQFLKGEIKLSDKDSLTKLSNDERKIILEELLNPSTDPMLYFGDGKLEYFPFFYYSKFHEKDAVSTSMQYIKEVISSLEKDAAQDLQNGIILSIRNFNKIYNEDTLIVAVQKDLRTYETKETSSGLENIEVDREDELIDIAMHEYLPISKALSEFGLLKHEGLSTDRIKLDEYNVDVSVNNNTWFLQLSKPFGNDNLEFCVMIKDNQCCVFRASAVNGPAQDKKNLEEVFDISKAFSKVYSEITGNTVDTYVITPIIGIYPEPDRQKLLSDVAKAEKLEYSKEPNTVFIKSQFKATDKTPYVSRLVSDVKSFILSKITTLDKKLDSYEKHQIAYTTPKQINNSR